MARKNASDQDQVGALRQQVDSLSQQSAALTGDAGRKASEAAATGARVAQEQTAALADVVRRQPLVALLVGIGLGGYVRAATYVQLRTDSYVRSEAIARNTAGSA
jgi:hypothetical protein